MIQRAQESANAIQNWNDAQVEEVLHWYIFEMDDESGVKAVVTAQALYTLGKRTHPFLLRMMDDPSLRDALLSAPGNPSAPAADKEPTPPFERLCKLFYGDAPAETVGKLAPFLNAEADTVRNSAALLLGETATAEAVSPIRAALAEAETRDAVISGLASAVEKNHVDPQCASALFEEIDALLAVEDHSSDIRQTICSVLLGLDRERSIELFSTGEYFQPGFNGINDVLTVLSQARVVLPRDRLLALLESLMAAPEGARNTDAIASTATLLGAQRAPEDRPILESLLNYTEPIAETDTTKAEDVKGDTEKVRMGAADGLLVSYGLDQAEEKIWDMLDSNRESELTVPQRRLNAVFGLDGEVNNGGFEQYFFNSDGAHWKDARDGLDAMKSSERAALLRQACALFGAAGPAEDREERCKQLKRIEQADEAAFDRLTDAYYDCSENLALRSARYILENAEAFQ
ncbi:MAG: DUF4375 domain-containing protein [Candidatus Hydrogenedentes bacterium]|nr:DUF4375 domain-containing protein [Candidatus Hydrogenedentota bacterium]